MTLAKANRIVAAGLGTLAAGVHLPATAAAVPSVEESKPIHRLQQIRDAHLRSLGRRPPHYWTDVQLAQWWGNFPNFPNFSDWNNWNNWQNGWPNF